jgi:hypothetical protein
MGIDKIDGDETNWSRRWFHALSNILEIDWYSFMVLKLISSISTTNYVSNVGVHTPCYVVLPRASRRQPHIPPSRPTASISTRQSSRDRRPGFRMANPRDGVGASAAALARRHDRRGSTAARAWLPAAGATSPAPATARVRETGPWRHQPRAPSLAAAWHQAPVTAAPGASHSGEACSTTTWHYPACTATRESVTP